jgi:hypothetical protein
MTNQKPILEGVCGCQNADERFHTTYAFDDGSGVVVSTTRADVGPVIHESANGTRIDLPAPKAP